MTGQLDDYRWLVSDEGQVWIDRAAGEDCSTVALAGRLRKALAPERARLVLQQVELRRRAQVKFAAADRMFFTPVGLEQSTDQWVAAHKAGHFPARGPVADLCCGIGGDLMALAQRGPAIGVDRDPITALLAEANLRALGGMRFFAAGTRIEDVSETALNDFAAWHLDPDRRPKGRRTTHLELHEPRLSAIRELLAKNRNGAVKLAPACDLPDDWAREAELEWISRDRQCRQLVTWFGDLAQHAGHRRATVLHGLYSTSDTIQARSIVGLPDVRVPTAPHVGRYVFEPDAAVLAAHLTGALAAEHNLAALAPGVEYLTADGPVADPALACFEITDVLPFDLKRLKGLLRDRGIGRLEIKKRGPVDLEEPEQLRRRLHLRGDSSAVLLLAPLARGVSAILARRVERGG